MKKRTRNTLLAVSLSLGLSGVLAGIQNEVTADSWHAITDDRTQLEGKLTSAVNDAFGIDARVRCTPPGGMNDHKLAPGTTVPMGGNETQWLNPWSPNYIRIHPLACAALSEAVSYDDREVDAVDNPDAVTNSISVLANQGAHARYDHAADVTECYTVQTTAKLARHLGASVELSQVLGQNIVDNAGRFAGDTLPPEDCVDEGPHDLNPNSPGYFSNGIPVSVDVN